MDWLIWVTVGFLVIGFCSLFSMKRSMESKVVLLIENEGSMDSRRISNKPIVLWIAGAVAWGLVSMFLVVWSFSAAFL